MVTDERNRTSLQRLVPVLVHQLPLTINSYSLPADMFTLVKYLVWAVACVAAKAFEQDPAYTRRGDAHFASRNPFQH